uniref:Transmembrane protein n=1 Tax=Noccaea caerulescens TaxID=107243 RepID=A0A1J3JIY8_NOCCA
MDQIVSGDIEGGRFNETQEEITTNLLSSEEKPEDVLNQVWSGRLSFDGSEKTDDEPLMGDNGKRRERSSQSLDLSDVKFDNAKVKKTRKPSSKPPRPPKGPALTANDQKLMREIAELAMRKRARIERMKTLRRMKAAKSSSPCSSVLAMIVTVIFFVFLIFHGLFTSASLNSDNSPAPTVSSNSRMVSVQFYNEFAPRERIDASPSTSFRYKRVSGADNEENTGEVSR